MPLWYSKPRFSTGSTVTVRSGTAAARPRRQVEPVERRPGRGRDARRGDQLGQQASRLARQSGDRRRILVVERGAQRRFALAAKAISLDNRRNEGRQGQIDRQMRHPDRLQGLARDRDRLDIGGRPLGADQLGAGLADLALGPHLRAFDPQYLAGIAEPQRPRHVRHPSGGDAGDLRRHVGAHPDHPVRDRVHQPEGVACRRGAGARQQRFLELDERRLDLLIAMRGQDAHQPPSHLGLDLRIGRQQIVEPGGQQGRVRGVIHGASRRVPKSFGHCVARPL